VSSVLLLVWANRGRHSFTIIGEDSCHRSSGSQSKHWPSKSRHMLRLLLCATRQRR